QPTIAATALSERDAANPSTRTNTPQARPPDHCPRPPEPSPTSRFPGRTSPAPPLPVAVGVPCPFPALPPRPTTCPPVLPCVVPAHLESAGPRPLRQRAAGCRGTPLGGCPRATGQGWCGASDGKRTMPWRSLAEAADRPIADTRRSHR